MGKLLILDDSAEVLCRLKYFLEGKDYIVKTFTDAFDTDKMINSFRPDLLLLDVMLPGGREICKKLRSRPETSQLGIMVSSASAGILTEYKTLQADDAIEKPFDLNVLYQKINSLLSWIPIRRKAHACV